MGSLTFCSQCAFPPMFKPLIAAPSTLSLVAPKTRNHSKNYCPNSFQCYFMLMRARETAVETRLPTGRLLIEPQHLLWTSEQSIQSCPAIQYLTLLALLHSAYPHAYTLKLCEIFQSEFRSNFLEWQRPRTMPLQFEATCGTNTGQELLGCHDLSHDLACSCAVLSF